MICIQEQPATRVACGGSSTPGKAGPDFLEPDYEKPHESSGDPTARSADSTSPARLDMTEGQPPGHTMRSCLIGMRIADSLELGPEPGSHLFYALLLKDAGCSSNAAPLSEFFASDGLETKRAVKTVNWNAAGGRSPLCPEERGCRSTPGGEARTGGEDGAGRSGARP